MTGPSALPALEEARDWIAAGETDAALDLLLPLLSGLAEGDRRGWRELRNEVITHAHAAAGTRRRARRGAITREEAEVAAARTAAALLDLIDDVERKLRRAGQPVPAQADPTVAMDLAGMEARPEKIIGRDNLKSIAWLSLGLASSRAVCRIQTPRWSGTGFHIGQGRILTNHHVVPDAKTAAQSQAEFNFQRGVTGEMESSVLFKAVADEFVAAPLPLDCALLRVPGVEDAFPALCLASGAVPEPGAPVSIIQHPLGGEKQIAVTSNEVVAVSGVRLVYLTDTLAGSSGAPVFDDGWNVVALHRAGGGTVRLHDGRRMRGNEGVLMSAILAHVELGPAIAAVNRAEGPRCNDSSVRDRRAGLFRHSRER